MKTKTLRKLVREAYSHTEKIMAFGPRGSTTENERAASKYVFDTLTGIGLKPILEEFKSPQSAWLPFALCFLVPAVAYLFALIDHHIGIWLACSVTLLGILWLIQEAGLQRTYLNRIIPHGTSQNVYARIPSKDKTLKKIVFLAHVDAHRTPIFMSKKKYAPIISILRIIGILSFAIEVIVYLLIGIWKVDVSLLFFLPCVVAQLALFLIFMQPDRTAVSPGANDNAASVGLILALAGYFHENPLENIELTILATGCEEVGCYGIRDFLPRHVGKFYNALFIDFELIGIGQPSLLTEEGLLKKQPVDKKLVDLFKFVSCNLGEPIKLHKSRVYGETYIINKSGFAGATLNCMPEGSGERYWHTSEDTLDKIQVNSLDAILRLISGFVNEVEARLNGFLLRYPDEELSEYGKVELGHALTKIRDIEGRRLQIAGLVLAGVSAALTYAFSEKLAGIIVIAAFISAAHLFVESTENRQVSAAYSTAIRYGFKYAKNYIDYNRLYLSSILYSSQKLRKLLRTLEDSALSEDVFESGAILGKHYERMLAGPVGTSALFVILSVILIVIAFYLVYSSSWAWF